MTTTNYFRPSVVVVAVVVAVLVGVVLMSQTNPASAAIGTNAVPGTTIVVNTHEDESTDDGDCSLREAITAANTNLAVDGCDAGSATQRDAIHFSLGKVATIVLNSTLPAITDASGLNINGLRAKITVSGDDSVRVFLVEGSAQLTLANLTVADGFATSPNPDGAGLLNNGGTVRVNKSTFSGNTAESTTQASSGGAILNLSTLTVINSTFSNNSASGEGGAIDNDPDAPATLRSTIVANSTSGGSCDADGPITDGGYNIEDGTSCGFSQANNSMPSTNPLLAASLADNGGPTQTIALMNGSPAINAIPRATNGCGTEVKTDQRGVSRPQGSGCDIGAFEKKVRRR